MTQKIASKKILLMGVIGAVALAASLLLTIGFGTTTPHPETEDDHQTASAQPIGKQPLGYIDITYATDSIEKVAAGADSIIVGKVLNKADVNKFDTRTNTVDATSKATIEVKKVLKGTGLNVGDIIEVQTVGNSQYIATNGADLDIGKNAILFVSASDGTGRYDAKYYIYGDGLGEYKQLANGNYLSKFHGELTENEMMAKIKG
jgi:hypothetical protein